MNDRISLDILELEQEFHDIFLKIQEQRDEALKRLERARGFLYPNERSYPVFKNPRLKIDRYGIGINAAMQKVNEMYNREEDAEENANKLELYYKLKRNALICIEELEEQRDAAMFEALRWEEYRREEEC